MADSEYKPLPCVSCGNSFTPVSYNQKTCSADCRLAHGRKKSFDYQRKKRDEKKFVVKPLKSSIACTECGTVFVALHSRHKTCSRKCLHERQKKYRPSRAVASKSLVDVIRKCGCCKSEFTPRTYQQRYCCSKCKVAVGLAARVDSYIGKRDSNKTCVCGECGTSFIQRDKRQITCSLKCSHKMYSRIGIRVRRARIAGVYTERFDPFEVFDRDGWRCQICGVSTPKSRRGTLHANAPELDHIKPISKGGHHTKENTQCSCKACNMWKSDRRVVGQMGLFTSLIDP